MIFEQLLLVLVLVLQNIPDILCRGLVGVYIYNMINKVLEEVAPSKVVTLFTQGFSL